MADFTIKQGDTQPTLVGTLTVNGAPLPDLNTATGVNLILALRSNPTVWTLKKAASITDAVNGKVAYLWGAGDTNTPGDYLGCWEVVYPGGSTRKCPTVGYFNVSVEATPQAPPP